MAKLPMLGFEPYSPPKLPEPPELAELIPISFLKPPSPPSPPYAAHLRPLDYIPAVPGQTERSPLTIMHIAHAALAVATPRKGRKATPPIDILAFAADIHRALRRYDAASLMNKHRPPAGTLRTAAVEAQKWLFNIRVFLNEHKEELQRLVWGPIGDMERSGRHPDRVTLGRAHIDRERTEQLKGAIWAIEEACRTLEPPFKQLTKQMEEGEVAIGDYSRPTTSEKNELIFELLDAYKKHFGEPRRSGGKPGPTIRYLEEVLSHAVDTTYTPDALGYYVKRWWEERGPK